MSEPITVDFCPTHKSLFPPKNRITCDAKYGWEGSDWSSDDPQMRRDCEWWVGTLVDLHPYYGS